MCLSFVIQSFVHFLTQSFFLLQMLIKLKTLSLQLPCIRCLFFINIRLKNTFFLLLLHFFNFLRLNINQFFYMILIEILNSLLMIHICNLSITLSCLTSVRSECAFSHLLFDSAMFALCRVHHELFRREKTFYKRFLHRCMELSCVH